MVPTGSDAELGGQLDTLCASVTNADPRSLGRGVDRIKRPCLGADTCRTMEQRPLPDSMPAEASPEPKLELVADAVVDAEPDEVDADDAAEAAAPTQDPLKLYVRQIGDGRLLTPAEERELARLKDEGDEHAKRKLIECNLRLVMSITRNYTKAGVPLL